VAIALGVSDADVTPEDNALSAIRAVEKLSERVGTARRGTDIGIERALVPTLVEDAMADLLMMGTPRFPEPRDVQTLYEAAL
jgi:alcohol dehydrogenase class IV